MLNIIIPGQDEYQLEHLVLDFNGTIAEDGKILAEIKEQIELLAEYLKVYVITADTNKTVEKECGELPVQVVVIGKDKQDQEKLNFINSLQGEVCAVGNGVNDNLMLKEAKLGIAVIGREGLATVNLLASDIVVNNINDAFNLLLKTNRLIATLRN